MIDALGQKVFKGDTVIAVRGSGDSGAVAYLGIVKSCTDKTALVTCILSPASKARVGEDYRVPSGSRIVKVYSIESAYLVYPT